MSSRISRERDDVDRLRVLARSDAAIIVVLEVVGLLGILARLPKVPLVATVFLFAWEAWVDRYLRRHTGISRRNLSAEFPKAVWLTQRLLAAVIVVAIVVYFLVPSFQLV